ncbi:porin [Trinickia mobilis]|uniref:porin n=1 Tax=Trinickia mobilis TaxID=2816356 RepID=UPI001F5E2064|nr:porin [Trinickia mobilis]
MRRYGVFGVLAFAAMSASGLAVAQSSVTIYGLISEGVAWTNNEGGASNVKLMSGIQQNNRLGFKISEDLGGGNRAVAQLENGFNITNGNFGQGGRMFGRQAFVGLSSNTLGTVTVGRQYDAFWDYIAPISAGVATNGLAAHPGDADNLYGSWRYNNSIKYVSPTIAGFNAQALYALSNAAGAFGLNRAYSAGVNYAQGGFKFAVAYVQLDSPGTVNPTGAVTDDYQGAPFFLFRTSPLNSAAGVVRQHNFGAGGRYDFGNGVRWNFMVDNIHYSYRDGTGLSLTNYDTSVTYDLTPALMLGAGYVYTQGSYGGLSANPHWHTMQVSLNYRLSKRTDVYIYNDLQMVSGPQAVADIYMNAPSKTRNQNLLVVGIRHVF